MLSNLLLVSTGAGFGVLGRVISSNWIKRKNPSSFPLATFAVNIVGSFFLGIMVGYGVNGVFLLLIGTGFLGSFTTFSTFNVENVELLRRKKYLHLFGYLGGSYVLGITLLLTGIFLGGKM